MSRDVRVLVASLIAGALVLAPVSALAGPVGSDTPRLVVSLLPTPDPVLQDPDYNRAFDRLDGKDFAGAASLLEKLVDRYPKRVSLAFHFALALYEGKDARALKAAQRVAALAPEDPDTLYLLLLVYVDQRDLGRTQETLDRLRTVSAEAKDPRVDALTSSAEEQLRDLGTELMNHRLDEVSSALESQDLAKAEAALQALQALESNDPVVHYHVGMLRYEQGRWLEALQAFDRSAGALESQNVIFMQALCLEALGREDASQEKYELLLSSPDPGLKADARAALDALAAGSGRRRSWTLESLGGFDSNPSFLASRTTTDEDGSEAVGQVTVRASRQLWRRGEKRLFLNGYGDFWRVVGPGQQQAISLGAELDHQRRRPNREMSVSLQPSLQTYDDRILTQGLALRGVWSWVLKSPWHVDLMPTVYGRRAPSEADAYLGGVGAELAGAIGWYRERASRQISLRAQLNTRRHQSETYRLGLGTEVQTWNSSAWSLGPSFHLYWQPRKGHKLTVDLELIRQGFDEPERVESIVNGETFLWVKPRVDASTQVRVQLAQKLWRRAELLFQLDLFGRESTVGAEEKDPLDRSLDRHYVGLGFRWHQQGL